MKKKMLIAVVAALFLATGTAHATEYYQCGGDKLIYVPYEGFVNSDDSFQWVNGSLLYKGEKCQPLYYDKNTVPPPSPSPDAALDDIINRDLGDAHDCPGASDYDGVFTKHEHVLSDSNRMIITIESITNSTRRESGKRVPYPVVQYNMETGKLTVNGKRCREAKEETR